MGIVHKLLSRHVFSLLDRVLAEMSELGTILGDFVEVQSVYSDRQDGGLLVVDSPNEIIMRI